MKAVIQRVLSASVLINGKQVGSINQGLLIFLGIVKEDAPVDLDYLVKKTVGLRIFNDDKDKMNLSIIDIQGEILIISQFTLLADIKKGRRPSFIQSAEPKVAKNLYNIFVDQLHSSNLIIKTGQFGAMMDIRLINNGPATFILNSRI